MRGYGKSMMIAALAASTFGVVAVAPSNVPVAESGYELAQRQRERIRVGGVPGRRFPSKGKQAHPKKRRNMNHVSRRTRRAHRRSRAA
jgi:hypothetical protein